MLNKEYLIVDFSEQRIGDSIALGYLCDYYKYMKAMTHDKDIEYVILDPNQYTQFSVVDFMPYLGNKSYDNLATLKRDYTDDIKAISFGNLWLSAPETKLKTGRLPHIVVPDKFKLDRSNYTSDKNKSIIVGHCLTNAPYNTRRNMDRSHFSKFVKAITDTFHNSIYIPVPTNYSLTPSQIIGLIDICDVYIGGDTGFTHCAAALDKPILAIYGPDAEAKIEFAEQQKSYGYESSWSSDPLSFSYAKIVMENHVFNIDKALDDVNFLLDTTCNKNFLSTYHKPQ